MESKLLMDLDDLTPHGLIDFDSLYQTSEWKEEEHVRIRNFSSIPLSSITSIDDKLKHKIRTGVPCSYRRKIWFIASGGLELYKQVGDIYTEALKRESELAPDADHLFGSTIEISDYLPPESLNSFHQFMRVVKLQNSGFDYAPMITSVCLFLLMFMEPPLAYLSIQAMLNRSHGVCCWYIATSKERFAASVFALRDIAYKSCKHVISHAEDILGLSISRMWSPFIPTFFLPLASLRSVLTVFDSFVCEGRKIISRLCVGILLTEKDILRKATTEGSFIDIVTRAISQMDEVPVLHALLRLSFGITLSRSRHLVKAESKFFGTVQCNPSIDVIGTMRRLSLTGIPMGPVTRPEISTCVNSRRESIPSDNVGITRQLSKCQFWGADEPRVIGGGLLSIELMRKLQRYMPSNIRRHAASLAFSMSDHGTTFSAMLSRCSAPGFYLLLVQTSGRKVAALLSDSLQPSRRCYYGRPSMFLFDITNERAYQQKPPPNNEFLFVDASQLLVGGPQPAIFLQDQFHRLASAPCTTFGSPGFANDPLGDPIYEVEVYRLQLTH